MAYALSCWQQLARQRAWQAYLAEALRLAGENAARMAGGGYLETRWTALLDQKPEETRTPEQVKQHMLRRLRGA